MFTETKIVYTDSPTDRKIAVVWTESTGEFAVHDYDPRTDTLGTLRQHTFKHGYIVTGAYGISFAGGVTPTRADADQIAQDYLDTEAARLHNLDLRRHRAARRQQKAGR